MIVSLYILFALLGVLFFLLAVVFGTLLKGEDADDKKNVGPAVLFILLAGILFTVNALHSLAITQDFCENQVTQSSVLGAVTTNNNQISCITERYSYQELAYFFYGLTAICVALFFYYVLRAFD